MNKKIIFICSIILISTKAFATPCTQTQFNPFTGKLDFCEAATGGGGSGTVNTGTAGYFTYYPSTGTTVDDQTILFLDGNNVGIGSTSPGKKLDIVGALRASTDIIVGANSVCQSDGTNCPASTPTGWTDGGTNVYTTTSTDNVGIGTSQPTALLEVKKPTGNLLYTGGNVGIGTTQPITLLDIQGDEVRIWTGAGSDANALASGELYVQGDLEVDGTIYGDGSQLSGIVTTPSGWTDGGTNVYATATGDNVGIGTTQPTYKLSIIDTINNLSGISVNNSNASSLTASGLAFGSNSAAGFVGVTSGSYVFPHLADRVLLYGDTTASGFSLLAQAVAGDLDIYTGGGATSNIRMKINASGNVGIGTTSPIGILDVRNDEVRIWTGVGTDSNALAAGELYVEGDMEVDGTLYFSTLNGTISAAGGWTDGGTSVYTTTSTDNVGIGTTQPVALLEVKGPTGNLLYSGGNVGLGTTNPEGAFIIRLSTGSAGWTIQTSANQACNTTCTATCMLGFDVGTLGVALAHIVNCSDASADECACAGSN